jgi:hypothetical protein
MGIADFALAGAPLAGGALLGLAAGNLKPSDVRAVIKQDIELLEMLPAEQAERRAELQRVIGVRIDDLIKNVDKGQSLRDTALSYSGNWRDIFVCLCAILFTIIWWNVDHGRTNWLMMFIVMILVSVASAVYAGRGFIGALRSWRSKRRIALNRRVPGP